MMAKKVHASGPWWVVMFQTVTLNTLARMSWLFLFMRMLRLGFY
jgi:hypothetical protein